MKASFDRLAPVYDLLAGWVFQGAIQRAQRLFLAEIPYQADVLFLGGGTGSLLPVIFRWQPAGRITYVEASSAMLSRAQRTVERYRTAYPNRSRPAVTFIHGSEEDLPGPATYQVVITNFVLDMYSDEDLPGLMQRIQSHCSDSTCWIFTDFRVSTGAVRSGWQRLLLRVMFRFFRLTAGLSVHRLPDYGRHFRALGWQISREQSFYGNFIVSRVYRRTSGLTRDAAPSGS